MEALRHTRQASVPWEAKPDTIADDHWRDLYVGGLFFTVRDAAIAVLDRLEEHLANRSEPRHSLADPLPQSLGGEIQALRHHAQSFLKRNYDPSPDRLAGIFCRECAVGDDANLIESLVNRDGRVLRNRERTILPGSAFRRRQTQDSDAARSAEEVKTDVAMEQTIEWPAGISHRIQNLFTLNLDLHGELGRWLAATQHVPEANDEPR
jgi:hypothetical protein